MLPGYYQFVKKHYTQGFCIFILFYFAGIVSVRQFLFFPQDVGVIGFFSLGCFVMAILWHVLFITWKKTSPTKALDLGNDVYDKGRLAQLNGNFEMALLCFKSILDKTKDEDAWYQLARTYQKMGELSKAKKKYEEYLDSSFDKWQIEVEDALEELKEPCV